LVNGNAGKDSVMRKKDAPTGDRKGLGKEIRNADQAADE
jgi:hypothetical protein